MDEQRAGATVVQAHGITAGQGGFNQAGRDINIHHHYHNLPGPTVNILDVLKLVSNLRDIHQDVLAKATPRTGIWFFKTNKFILWVDVNGELKVLWGTGIPGAGKSVMASIVINDLEARAAETNGSICVAYIYFRYSDATGMTFRSVLEILIKQIVERHPNCAVLAEQVYARHLHERTQPTEAELLQLLQRFTETTKITFYVLDALDEAPEKLQVTLVEKLAALNARLFITSRPLKDVEARVPSACSFAIMAQDGDLDLHIRQEIEESRNLQGLFDDAEPSFKDDMISLIKQNCGGMFLHASLQLEAISYCSSPQDVIETLEGFPSEMDAVYRQTWERICRHTPKNVMLARSVLIWVLTAARSMTVDELRHAIATSPDTRKFERKRLVPVATLLTLCCGLITAEEETRLVRLVHYTAKDTLEHLLCEDFPHPHSLLAAVCMTHLAECGFQDTTIASEDEYATALKEDPLLAYASHAWATHARESLHIPEIIGQTTGLISNCKVFPSFTDPKRSYEWDILGPLHILALYHLPFNSLPGRSIWEPNIATKIAKDSPLILASRCGNEEMVQDLLRLPDIEVNHINRDGTSALMLAAEQGYGCIVDMLLARPEVQVNMIDNSGRAALVSAAHNGHEGIVAVLLARYDTQVNLVSSAGWSALELAIVYGYEAIIKLLLAHPDVNVNLTNNADGFEGTALIEAASRGLDGVVKLLLERPEIEVNLVDSKGWSAFLIAAQRGHENIVKLFLADPRVQVNMVNKQGWSALVLAIDKGHEGTVKLLLAHPDTNVNLANNVDGSGWTALMKAVSIGLDGITQLLLERPEIEINSVSNAGWTALAIASGHGYRGIVQLFLAHPRIQVNVVDNNGWSALMWAANDGHSGTLKLLLAYPDVQVDLLDLEGRSALRLAAIRNHRDIVKLLFAHRDGQLNAANNQERRGLKTRRHTFSTFESSFHRV